MEKKKLLIYNSTLLKGGTESYFINLAKHLPKDQFDVEVVIKNGDDIDQDQLNILNNLNIKTHLIHGNLINQMKSFKKFFSNHKNVYDIVHINATSAGNGIISYFAKKFGKAKQIIFHSHMSNNDTSNKIVDFVGSKLLKKNCTDFVACSTLAYDFMFGKNFKNKVPATILKNSIDINKFEYNPNFRNQIRSELKINDSCFVFVHVGRLCAQKNQEHIIKVFSLYKQHNSNSKLLLVGIGDDKQKLENLATSLNVKDDVLFLGSRNDVEKILNASDILVFPSIKEALGIVAIEAQASNLPVVASTDVPEEAKVTENFKRISLSEPLDVWVSQIKQFENVKRKSCSKELHSSGFSNEKAIQSVIDLYNKK